MAPTKVFVGNLSFKTKESELAEHFQPYQVVSVHIITRGPRSLGYGFIELDNEESANKSVQEMNKKPIDGRDINVELAKPRQSTPKNPRSPGRGRGRGRGASNGSNRNSPAQTQNNQENNQNTENNNNNNNNNSSNNNGEGADQNAKPRNFRRRYRRPRNQQPRQANNNDQGQAQGQEGSPAPRSDNQPQQGQGQGQSTDSPSRGRRPRGGGRGPRGRGFYERPPRNTNRIESATALFVANLPFDLKEDRLLELFKDFNATKAHVVTNYQGRSRGFGFVEFANETDQNEAFNKTNQNKIVISDRTLTVKLVQLKEKAPESLPVETTNTVAPATNLPTTATA